MRFILSAVVLLGALIGFSPLINADNVGGWQFDSSTPVAGSTPSDAQLICEVLRNLVERWNAHDIDGYMEFYRNSPDLLVVVDSEQFNGWQQVRDSYVRAYANKESMGEITTQRIQCNLLKPDLALALVWWSMSFPNSKQKVVGNSMMNLQRFAEGWKIVASHSSTAEM